MVNRLHISGRLGVDPRTGVAQSGNEYAQFSLAWNERRNVDGEWQDGETFWFNVTCWRGLARRVAEHLQKGMPVEVVGRVTHRSYQDKQSVERFSVDITAESVTQILVGGGHQAPEPQDPWGGQAGGDSPQRSAASNALNMKALQSDEPPF